MQRNVNIEQTSEINKDFFVISQRVKQIFAVYCKYAKKSKNSAFLQILWVSLQKSSPLFVPRINGSVAKRCGDKIFAVVMKKRSLVATLCRDDNCAMTSRGNLFNRHR